MPDSEEDEEDKKVEGVYLMVRLDERLLVAHIQFHL